MLKNLDETQFKCAKMYSVMSIETLHKTIKFATVGSGSSCFKISIVNVIMAINYCNTDISIEILDIFI